MIIQKRDTIWEKEALIQLYMQSKNQSVLRTLIDKYGHTILTRLGHEGMEMFCEATVLRGFFDLYYSLDTVGEMRPFHDMLINLCINEGGSWYLQTIEFLRYINWNMYNTTTGYRERFVFFLKLVLSHKKDRSDYEEFIDAFLENKHTSFELALQLIKELPEMAEHMVAHILDLHTMEDGLITLANCLHKIRVELVEYSEKRELINVDAIMRHAVDRLLESPEFANHALDLFTSVIRINTIEIAYNSEMLKLIFDRLIRIFHNEKEDIEFSIEDIKDRYFEFPLDIILDDIAKRNLRGLSYVLFQGNSIRSYNVVVDGYTSEVINLIELAFTTYYRMEIIPADYIDNIDTFYHNLVEADKFMNSTIVDNSPSNDVDTFDVEGFLSEL